MLKDLNDQSLLLKINDDRDILTLVYYIQDKENNVRGVRKAKAAPDFSKLHRQWDAKLQKVYNFVCCDGITVVTTI